MGLKRVATPKYLPLWIFLLVIASAVLFAQFMAERSTGLPTPVTGNDSTDKADGPVARDRISPLKDGTGN